MICFYFKFCHAYVALSAWQIKVETISYLLYLLIEINSQEHFFRIVHVFCFFSFFFFDVDILRYTNTPWTGHICQQSGERCHVQYVVKHDETTTLSQLVRIHVRLVRLIDAYKCN